MAGLALSVPTLVALLAAAALALAWRLARASGGGRALPGCGAGSGCDAVAASRWARVGPVPVAWLGVGCYGLLTLAAFARHPLIGPVLPPAAAEAASTTLAFAAFAAAAAGAWFTAVQAVALRRFCRHCSAIHALTAVTAALVVASTADRSTLGPPAAVAMVAVATLAGAQIGWRPRTFAVTPLPGGEAHDGAGERPDPIVDPATHPSGSAPPDAWTIAPKPSVRFAVRGGPPAAAATRPTVVVAGPPRRDRVAANPFVPPPRPASRTPAADRLVLAGGNVVAAAGEWPTLGPPDAPHRAMLLFDFTCRACRQAHRAAAEAVDRSTGSLALVCVPVPQCRSCNPLAPPRRPGGVADDACGYARLALALHAAHPAAYPTFARWVATGNAPPPLAEAVRWARSAVPASDAHWPPGPAVEARLAAAVEVYRASRVAQVPAVLLPRAALTGVASADQLLGVLRRELAATGPAATPSRVVAAADANSPFGGRVWIR